VHDHYTPLPNDVIASAQDCLTTMDESKKMQQEYNIYFASCIGTLIYLSHTQPDIIYVVNKLAKYTKCPGEYHMDGLLHLLRYLCGNACVGLMYYSDVSQSPMHALLSDNKVNTSSLLITFSDSSWNDDMNNGQSTGAFFIFYMRGIVDHSSDLPDPIVLSSAESEYNQACLACMATAHLQMFLNELEGRLKVDGSRVEPLLVILDNRSAIDMGASYKTGRIETFHALKSF